MDAYMKTIYNYALHLQTSGVKTMNIALNSSWLNGAGSIRGEAAPECYPLKAFKFPVDAVVSALESEVNPKPQEETVYQLGLFDSPQGRLF